MNRIILGQARRRQRVYCPTACGLGELSSDRHGLRDIHLMGGMEGDLQFAVDAELGHHRAKTLLTELVERLFTAPDHCPWDRSLASDGILL
jgi:hypothetical protein